MKRCLILLCILLLTAPVSAAETPVLFSPGSDSISSAGIRQVVNGREGSVIFATDHGRSEFTGEWSRYYHDPGNPGASPLGNFVRTVEFDAEGNLWIGYSNGLQILTPQGYTTIDDQQLLKNLAINDLKRRSGEMWVATGRAGVHRYADRRWTWYRPNSPDLSGEGTVEKILVDYRDGSLYLVTPGGIFWLNETYSPDGRFEPVLRDGSPLTGISGGVSDPHGGILLFNSTLVLHLDAGEGYSDLVFVEDLLPGAWQIFDIAATRQGGLLVGTDDGIACWEEGNVRLHLDRDDGLPDARVKKLFLDAQDRLWFATPSSVGYLRLAGTGPVIPISSPPREAPSPEIPESTPSAPANTPAPEMTQSFGEDRNLFEVILDWIFGLY